MDLAKDKKYAYIGIAVVIILAVVLVVLNDNSSISAASPSLDNVQLSAQTLSELHTIANNESLANKVGSGTIAGFMTTEKNTTEFMTNGTPTFLYIGADFCPYCAEARWGIVLALMRFGNFTKLHYMTSSASDAYPNTPTFTFYNSSYASNLLDFQEVELTTNKFNASLNTYPSLQTPNALQKKLFSKYDAGGSIPFVDIANRSIMVGSPIIGGLLTKYTWIQMIADLNDSNSVPSQNVIGAANLYTANICEATGFKPASVCDQPYIKILLSEQS
jgi:thiol-disulfide isomerase/thioredoxin